MSRVVLSLFCCLLLTAALRADDGIIATDTAPTVALPFDLAGLTDRDELAFAESPAYYGILDHVRRVDQAALQSAAADVLHKRWSTSPKFSRFPIAEFPLFYDLTKQPEAYRGQPMTMHGHLIRLVKYDAGPNEHGIETLYEGWLIAPDAETHPATIICTEIPDGMPIGEELIDGVSVTGYFFKLHTYSSRDRKVRFAPMILARTMTWSPPATTGWPVSTSALIGGLILFAIVASLAIGRLSSRHRRERDARLAEPIPQDASDFLNDLSTDS